MLVIGLISGTSLDGIDAALVEFGERWELRAFTTLPYTKVEREKIHRTILEGGPAELCALDAELGEWFAEAAEKVAELGGVELAEVDLIGSHGQTIWHIPPTPNRRGASLQLGCAATIAERTGVDVVSDFRARDLAAGGEGAPLVPWVDQELFSAPDQDRVLLNIGGMANLTWVPSQHSKGEAIAFDTGPGNALIDTAVEIATAGLLTYDEGGARAARGTPNPQLLAELLDDPYFDRYPPKSTGREHFGRPLVERIIARIGPLTDEEWDDLIATLTCLTAESIITAIERWVRPLGLDEVIVSGGGVHNRRLLELLQTALDPIPVLPSGHLGIDPDAKEAVAFAALARAHHLGVPANLPRVTGAAGPRILGSLTPGRVRG